VVSERIIRALQAARYVPGGLVFTGAALDHKGHILLEGGGEVGRMPAESPNIRYGLFGWS